MDARKLLLPVSGLYALGAWLHAAWYRWRIRTPYTPSIPTLAVGNLHVGGTGKTPLSLWILEALQGHVDPVVYLSRGYGRRTKEVRTVQLEDRPEDVGDEALMVRQHFGHSTDVQVMVALRRDEALRGLPKGGIAVLDDAFQHRRVQASLNLLVCPFGQWYTQDHVLPAGRLREHPSAARRAQAVVVTRCPGPVDPLTRLDIRKTLDLRPEQELFCSWERYGEPLAQWDAPAWDARGAGSALALCGIGQPAVFLAGVRRLVPMAEAHVLGDHEPYRPAVIKSIAATCRAQGITRIITTKKDRARMGKKPAAWAGIDVYVLPHEIVLDDDGPRLLKWLEQEWKARGFRVPLRS
ncbi:MAG: tetraacyldisaccharide 4'-kinase [Schleiferiaceae bacterium]